MDELVDLVGKLVIADTLCPEVFYSIFVEERTPYLYYSWLYWGNFEMRN